MDKGGVIKLLTALNGKHIRARSQDWVETTCVFAPWKHKGGVDSHPSGGVKISNEGESFYNCFTCGSSDLLQMLHELKRLGASPPAYDLATATELVSADGEGKKVYLRLKDEWGQIEESEPEIPFSEAWLGSFPPAIAVPKAQNYLMGRGLSERLIAALDIRYDYRINAVCFPLRNFDGELRGLRGRRLEPGDFPPYHIYRTGFGKHNPLVWYGEHLLDFDKPIVMVESVFDLASVYRVYTNVCAPLSANFSKEKVARMDRATSVVLFFDDDPAGNVARHQVRKCLSKSYISEVFPTGGAKDPGEMHVLDLIELLKPFVKLDGMEV